jgi:tRNA-dihydrouridine synthase B
VLVNGDIQTPADARAALDASGATGVMIGRGAYGAPWLPGQIARFLETGIDSGAPPLEQQAAVALEHVDAMLSHYGRGLGLRNARKHIGWYLESSGRDPATVRAWRKQLCTEDNPEQVLSGLSRFYGDCERAAA